MYFYTRIFFGGVKTIKELRINEMIRGNEVRLIGEDSNEQLGIMPLREAQKLAIEKGLDLVEISPTAKPPVCKIMDYGKYYFEQTKKEREAKKNQKVINLKEIKLRPNIEDHDFETKAKNAEKFLKNGDKLKVTIMFRGREVTHPELGQVLCDKMVERLAEFGQVEKPAKLEGRNMTMIITAKNS